MRLTRISVFFLCLMLLAAASPTAAQEFRGRINGTVTDNTGAVLPGVTVTATSPALIQPQVQVTGSEGDYRLIALPPGVYELTFELSGFQTVKREDIRVVINTTLTVDQPLQVASLQETVTVTGDSPVVDTSTTHVGTNFTKEMLTEIPNARDIWAAMAQAPGFQMTGYDVGGSHTGTQTGFMAYGLSQQRTTRIEGINTTEGTDANAGYFDFGSFEEFQLGGAGNMADHDTAGGSMNIIVKSGGDRFSGNWYSDWEGDATITDNVPDEFKVGQPATDERGFFVRAPLAHGNAIDRQYDINANIGGPLWKGKAWFFYSYRLNDQYKYVLELRRARTFEAEQPIHVQGHVPAHEEQPDHRLSQQAREAAGAAGPRSQRARIGSLLPVVAQLPMEGANGRACLSDRMFLDVIVGNWYNFFPLDTTANSGAFTGTLVARPHRDRTGESIRRRSEHRLSEPAALQAAVLRPRCRTSRTAGMATHDFKFGAEGRRERAASSPPQPFNHVYYDATGGLGRTPQEIEFYNTPNTAVNQTNNVSAYVNDTWRFNSRLTLNLGLRVRLLQGSVSGAERNARGRSGTHRRRDRPQPAGASGLRSPCRIPISRARRRWHRGPASPTTSATASPSSRASTGASTSTRRPTRLRRRSIPLDGRGCAIVGPT